MSHGTTDFNSCLKKIFFIGTATSVLTFGGVVFTYVTKEARFSIVQEI